MKDDDDEKTAIEKEIATVTQHRDDLESQLEGIDAELRDAQSRDGSDGESGDRGDADGNNAPDQDASQGQEDTGPSVATLEGERNTVQEGVDRDNKTLSSLEKTRDGESGEAHTSGPYEGTAEFGARGPSGEVKEMSVSVQTELSPPTPPDGGGPDGGSGNRNGSGNPQGTPRTGQPSDEQQLGQQLVDAYYKVSDTQEGDTRRLGKDMMQMTQQQDAALGVGNLPQDPVSTVAFAVAVTAAVIEDKGQRIVDAVEGLDQRSDKRVNEALDEHKPSEENVRDNKALEEIHAEDVGKEQAARDQREAKGAEGEQKNPDVGKETQSDVMAAVERDDAAKWAQAKESKDSAPAQESATGKPEPAPSIGGPDDSKFLSSLQTDKPAPMPEPGAAESKLLSEMGQTPTEIKPPSEPVIGQPNGQEPAAMPTPSEPAMPQASRDGDGNAGGSKPPADRPASQIAANDNQPPQEHDDDHDR